MQSATLSVTKRKHLGTKHTRRIRERGQIPAIIFGHGQKPIPVALDAHETRKLLLHHSRTITLDIEGQAEQYLIKAVQYDHLDTTPIHLDLMRVDKDERVQVQVQIILRGEPEGVHEGGVLTQLLSVLDVECVMTAIPEDLRPSVNHLKVGDSLLVREIDLPPGVTSLSEPEEKVAICRVPTETVEEEEAAAEEGEGAAEPEIISKGKAEEEGGASS